MIAVLICTLLAVSAGRAFICLVYGTELVERSLHRVLFVIIFGLMAVKMIFTALSFDHAQDDQLFWHLYFFIALNLLILPLLWVLPESPNFLHCQSRTQEFYSALIRLHQINHYFSNTQEKLDVTKLAEKEPSQHDS